MDTQPTLSARRKVRLTLSVDPATRHKLEHFAYLTHRKIANVIEVLVFNATPEDLMQVREEGNGGQTE